jgi:organic radical activating enzyme
MITKILNNDPSNLLRIEYMPGNLCNYKCHYCFPGSNEGNVKWPDIDLVLKNFDHLLNTYKAQGKTKFEIFILGGETTLWKDLTKFCNHLKNNYDLTIRISTNASRKLNWWEENAKCFDVVEISVHHEYCNIDHIIEVGDLLYRKKTNIVAKVLMDPFNFDKCIDLVEKLKKSKKRWGILAKAVQINDKSIHTELQQAYLANQSKRWPNIFWYFSLKVIHNRKLWVVVDGRKRLIEDNWLFLNDLNRFKGWECNLGVDYIEIFQDGVISGTCKQMIYNEQFHYNLYDREFVNKFKPKLSSIICKKEVCVCSAEIQISKFIPIKAIQ